MQSGAFLFLNDSFGPTWPEVLSRGELPRCRSPPSPFRFTRPPKPKWRYHHEKINLRDLYPFYHNDLFVEVSDEVAAALAEAERMERNYIRRVYWNKAYFSLDAGDGIEHEALFIALSPCELYERKVTAQELRSALNALPDTQGPEGLRPLHTRLE